jgi:hypothetical protein
MKRAIMATFAAVLAIGSVMASVSEANAVVCARGVYRAGCAGPRGAVVTHRRVYAPRAYYRPRAYVRPRAYLRPRAYVRRRVY